MILHLIFSESSTVPGRMAGGCHNRLRVATPGKACHAGAPEYQPATPRGRPVPVPVWRAAARAASVSPWRIRVAGARRKAAAAAALGTRKVGERCRSARSLRRGGRCAGRRPAAAASETAVTVPGRMAGGCHNRLRVAPPDKACRAGAREYQPATPRDRPVPVPGMTCGTHAPRA
jgi:hypothetical protein